MSNRIFVSYRRADTQQAAGRLADDLGHHFGGDKVFRDVENIGLGLDFSEALNRELESCGVMLTLIGAKWLSVTDEAGARRLDNPDDWIRQEIATALRRNIRVVPVLIDGATLPAADALPDELRALVRRQGLELADARWRGDVARLIETLERLPGLERPVVTPQSVAPAPAPVEAAKPNRAWIKWAAGVAGVLFVLYSIVVSQPDGTSEPAANGNPPPAGGAPANVNTPATLAALPAPAASGAVDALASLAGEWRQDHTRNFVRLTPRGAGFDVIHWTEGGSKVFGEATWADNVLTLKIGQPVGNPPRPAGDCRLSRVGSSLSGQCANADGSKLPMTLSR